MGHYNGSCHCGAVTFEVETDLSAAMMCDCSICRRKNAVMTAVTQDKITITSGEDNLSLYQFNMMAAKHYFCKTCGIYTHHKRRRDDLIGVNTGCLENLDAADLPEITYIEGSQFSTVEK